MKKHLICLLFLTLFSYPAQAFSIKHDFNVFIGVFNASNTDFTYSLTPQDYSVKSSVKTAGVFDTLYPFKADYATTGKIKGKELETTSYKYKSQSRFSSRRKELIYDQNGIPVYRISAKNDKEKKVKIEPDVNNKDTTDLQTVIAELAMHYNKEHNCNARMQVFDGKKRYDAIFKDNDVEYLRVNENTPFSGTARKCSMYIDRLASDGDDLLWDLTSEKPINFWILKDQKTQLPFIAKIEIEDTPLGKLQVFTKKITIEETKNVK